MNHNELMKCYILDVAFCDAVICTLRKVDQNTKRILKCGVGGELKR